MTASGPGLSFGGYRSAHQGLVERLAGLHDQIRNQCPGVHRLAVAIYDERTDILKSFVHSSEGPNPFEHTVARLADLRPLAMLARTGGRRSIHDLSNHPTTNPSHNRRLVAAGYLSSYTVPIIHRGQFQGFVFFNSCDVGYFAPPVVAQLNALADVVVLHTVMELDGLRMIQAAVHTVRQISRVRDEETGTHLERMSRYARQIASRLAPRHHLGDEWVEFLFQFSPLHDVGKVAVPDAILLKPGRLTEQEYQVMKGHVAKGVEIIEVMTKTFRLGGGAHVQVLRNVVAHHHEAMDGSGYPLGLKGDEISLEGRITAVADVFDALTSVRPYKEAWPVDRALDFLKAQAGLKFDPEAVDALCASRAAITDIQGQFAETRLDG